MNTKEKLFGLKLKCKTVTVDGVDVMVKEMSAGDGSEYEQSLYSLNSNGTINYNLKEARVKLVMLSCYDTDDNRLFEAKDIELVKTLPNHVLSVLYDEACKINNLSDDGKIDLDEAAKN